MKNIGAILHKKYDKDIRKTPFNKQRLTDIQKLCKEYNLDGSCKDEFAFFQLEILYEGILNKQKFEDTFLTTYVSMHDFWAGLDYKERSHHMSVDIDRMRKDVNFFPYGEDEIYLPMFDERMNRLYIKDTALLELKQYGRFIKEFQDVIQKNHYGILPYQYNFSSCQFILGDNDYFTIYNKEVNRLYFIRNYECISTLSFDPECKDVDVSELMNLAHLYMNEKEVEVAQALLQSTLIQDKVKKKLEKFIKKVEKKK